MGVGLAPYERRVGVVVNGPVEHPSRKSGHSLGQAKSPSKLWFSAVAQPPCRDSCERLRGAVTAPRKAQQVQSVERPDIDTSLLCLLWGYPRLPALVPSGLLTSCPASWSAICNVAGRMGDSLGTGKGPAMRYQMLAQARELRRLSRDLR